GDVLVCRRFAVALTGDRARLGVDVDRYSFIVSDLHRLLVAGLPAHCERFCTSSHTFIRREIRAIEDTPPVKPTLPMSASGAKARTNPGDGPMTKTQLR